MQLSEQYTIFPYNMRNVERTFCWWAFLGCVAANFVLAALALTTKVRGIRDYSRVILINCSIDTIATFLVHFCKLQFELSDGYLLLVIDNGFLVDVDIQWYYWCAFLEILSYAATIHVIGLMFYFRYRLICRGETMSGGQLFKLSTLILLYTICECGFLAYSLYSTSNTSVREEICRRVLNHPIWQDSSGPSISKCIFTNMNSLFYVAFLVSAIFIHTVVYLVMGRCAYSVWRDLRAKREQFSQRTQRLHRQMNYMLAAQMLAPLFTAFLPVFNFILFPILHLSLPGIGLLASLLVTCVPLSNPLITICFIGPFRRNISSIVFKVLPIKSRAKSSWVGSSAVDVRTISFAQRSS